MGRNKQVIVITGSSRGIGAATAIEAARRGYSVCINYLNDKEKAERVKQEVISLGAPCLIVRADVSQQNEVERMFQEVEHHLGPVTALVNNVGILQEKMNLVDMPLSRVEQVLKTNVLSVFACCQEAIKQMAVSKGGKGGAIVNVSSAASRLGSAGEYIDYAASKGAMDTLTIGLSKEVAADNIRVNSVRPGFIHTDIHRDGGEAERVNRLAPILPMRRGGEPEEVANAILWLLSDESSYVTGSFIDLAGGL
ncbi:NAD(P)-dependent oxidoreductase [Photobacterium kishitanii]|uniref:SDR family oxidoreductase n=1 Tax=Photobacterium kishitanii TaxID=318456 RepID=UPI000D157615|nr:SDR family oxidoreductase [Photobacterium kishitanii]PSU82914.1 NAD(P)-dependent oxidoreductase [Photobacterium kishitanii]